MEFVSDSDREQSRKRKIDLFLNRTPAVKLPRLSSPERFIDSCNNMQLLDEKQLNSELANCIIEMTPSNSPHDATNDDGCNFRRFGTRDRKRTNFFTPVMTDEFQQFGSSSKLRNQSGSKIFDNARRVLHFEQSPIVPAKEESSSSASTISVSPIPQPQTSLLKEALVKDTGSPIAKTIIKLFPIGTFVWGKLPGYDWWPGCVVSYDKKEIEKFTEEMDEEEDDTGSSEDDGGSDEVAWVKWYGDNQLSLLSCKKLSSFGQFPDHFAPSRLKGLYRKALFTVLREASKRCNIEALFKNEDKTLSWAFHSLLYGQIMKKNVIESASPQRDLTVDLPFSEIFTKISSESVDGKNKSKERGVVHLTGVEKELLHWALDGFLPSGPCGFKPRPEHLVDVKIVPFVPKTEQDSTYTPSMKQQQRHSKKNNMVDGGRRGYELDKEQLAVIETRNKAQFELVASGQIDIEGICIGCGKSNISTRHPLFHGGLCTYCKDMFMQCAYLFDDDGTQMYCTVCSAGNEVFMCDTPNCSKVFCGVCIEKLCGQDELKIVSEVDKWQCYMCLADENKQVGLMKRRENWDKELHELFMNDNEIEFEPPKFYSPICAEDRKPIRVLGLFDGIGTGLVVLKELGIEVELYVSSEIDNDAIKVSRVNHEEMHHVGPIEYITEKEIKAWGPFDIVMGGSPCNDLSIVNPARKGIYDGTGRLFFEFYRILNYAKPHPDDPRPFFWMFENVVSMRAVDKQVISRFLQCNPVVVDAREISAAHRARFFWGNLPGMNRPTVPLPGDRLTLQSCLDPNCFRTAQFHKLRTVTTKMNSIKQTKKAIFPIKVAGDNEDEGDVLWCTEMERLFGFPIHYTDVGNLGRCGRQRLLGKAWSVPVARHLLSPLKDYFKSRTTGVPASVKFGTNYSSDDVIVTNEEKPHPVLSIVEPAEPQIDKVIIDIRITDNNNNSVGLDPITSAPLTSVPLNAGLDPLNAGLDPLNAKLDPLDTAPRLDPLNTAPLNSAGLDPLI